MVINGYEIKPYAYLRGADLWCADLWCADLRGASLRDADLCGANLRGANLRGADLCGANLRGADLCGANLRDAYLRGANLCGANLRDADLCGAYLRGASLRDADLCGAKLPHFQIVPEEGSFIAWKKLSHNVVAKLNIPASAKRTSSLIGRKCRASKVKTVKLYGAEREWCLGRHDRSVGYKVGKITEADSYDSDIRIECTNGIHFFMTRKEAEEW